MVGTMTNATTERIKRALQTHQPATVVVKLADDSERELAPGGKRARWVPVLHALSELPWVTAELRDAKGRTLGPPIRNDGAAAELETLAASPASARTQEVAQLIGQVTRATADNLAWFTSTLKPTLDLAREMSTAAMTGSEYWRKEAESQRAARERAEARLVKVEAQLARLLEAHEADDDKGWAATVTEIAEHAPQLFQLAGLGMRLLKGAPTTPPRPSTPPAAPAPKAAP